MVTLKEYKMGNQCYICNEEAKEDITYLNGDKNFPYARNIYTIKNGFFSKEKIIICLPCKRHLEILLGNKITDKILSKEIVLNINNYREKIIKAKDKEKERLEQERAAIPIITCPICNKKDRGLRLVKCNNCSNEYCNSCLREYLDKNDKKRELILKDGFTCENCFLGNLKNILTCNLSLWQLKWLL